MLRSLPPKQTLAVRPKQVFYGNNRADFSFIAGNTQYIIFGSSFRNIVAPQ
jgi:hypothetical protein